MQINRSQSSISHNKPTTVSIVIPTYNEAENILKLIEAIKSNLPYITSTEIIVVDVHSPDGTGRIVENYIHDITTGGATTNQININKIITIFLLPPLLKLLIDKIRGD